MDGTLNEKARKGVQSPALQTAKAKRKKKYVKPSLIYQAPLEAMAATCSSFPGKVSGICGTPFS